MAKGRNGPSIEELFGKDDVPADTGEAPARPVEIKTEPVLDIKAEPLPEAVSVSPPLHRLHETRQVHNAGRMVVGTTVAVPQHLLKGPSAAFVEATTPILTAEPPAKRAPAARGSCGCLRPRDRLRGVADRHDRP